MSTTDECADLINFQHSGTDRCERNRSMVTAQSLVTFSFGKLMIGLLSIGC